MSGDFWPQPGDVVSLRFGVPGPDITTVRVEKVYPDGFFDGYDLEFKMPLTRVNPALCWPTSQPQPHKGTP